jgi:hypothetical protein
VRLPNTEHNPDWLRELQLKSWEPEILLSGIVLYGMFQLPEVLDNFLLYFAAEIYNGSNAMDNLVALLKMGVYWMITGLILHLICRGLWVGLVGLSYSFPDGIQVEKLKFQPKYRARVERIPSFEELVLKLERVCSFIYSVSFLLFMSLVGGYLYCLVLIVLPILACDLLYAHSSLAVYLWVRIDPYINIMLMIGFLGVIDFITLGYLRRFKIWGIIYWPLYKVFNALTLAKYYRSTYFALITNLNRWGVFVFMLTFIFVSFLGVSAIRDRSAGESFSQITIWSNAQGNKAYEGYYQDKEFAEASRIIQIQSDIIKEDVLRVFIPVHIEDEDSLKKYMNYDSIQNLPKGSLDVGSYYLEQYAAFFQLSIDDSTFDRKNYFQYRSASKQKGYITYLNIGYLKEGLHELKFRGPEKMYGKKPFVTVPFYKLD